MYFSYLVGVLSGFVIFRQYYNNRAKYDTWALIGKSIVSGMFVCMWHKVKRKVMDPDLMGSSGVYLRGGNQVEWTEEEFARSGRLTSQQLVDEITNGNGKNTFLVDVVDKDDNFWRVWVTGHILYSDPVWPFNEVVVDDREGITEAVVKVGESIEECKKYRLTAHFIGIDGPHNNFGANTNVPIWVAVKVMIPHVDVWHLRAADVTVTTVHGAVQMNCKKTLHELHRALVQMENAMENANGGDADGELSDEN